MENMMDDIKALFDEINIKLTGLEIKLDAILYYLAEEMEDEQGGDKFGIERDSTQTL